MPWDTPTFEPFPGKATVGNLTATFNAGRPDEFAFVGSVNLDVPETIDDFYRQVEKALASRARRDNDKQAEGGLAKKLASIADGLNAKVDPGAIAADAQIGAR